MYTGVCAPWVPVSVLAGSTLAGGRGYLSISYLNQRNLLILSILRHRDDIAVAARDGQERILSSVGGITPRRMRGCDTTAIRCRVRSAINHRERSHRGRLALGVLG